MVLHIPPKQLHYEETSLCSAECGAKALNGTTRYLTEVVPHMHYLGKEVIATPYNKHVQLQSPCSDCKQSTSMGDLKNHLTDTPSNR